MIWNESKIESKWIKSIILKNQRWVGSPEIQINRWKKIVFVNFLLNNVRQHVLAKIKYKMTFSLATNYFVFYISFIKRCQLHYPFHFTEVSKIICSTFQYSCIFNFMKVFQGTNRLEPSIIQRRSWKFFFYSYFLNTLKK